MVITKAEVFRITRITNCPIGIRIHTDTGLFGDEFIFRQILGYIFHS